MTKTKVLSLTIANGVSLSGAIDLGDLCAVLVVMPVAWTAANLTFQASHDGVTYQNVYDGFGVEYSLVAAAARNVAVPPSDLVGARFIKIRSGTSGTPVNQGAARTLYVVARSL